MADDQPTVTQTVTLPQGGSVTERLAAALGGQYAVGARVGSGGFAEVYEVQDRQLERRLAVKVLRPDLIWAEGTLARFREEARAIAALDHPNILPLHFVGDGQGLVYYAMPFVDGEPLTAALKREGPMPVARAVPIALGILAALEHAHESGLVHRDIKPDNIMLDARTGRPLVVDFGIAKRLDGSAGNTQAGFVVGTPAYMSPEQAMGCADLDGRADLYSLGAMLFHMVTGAPPYEGEDSQEVVRQHLSAPVPAPESRREGIPPWLSVVIVRALAKDRGLRFQRADEMAGALRLEAGPPGQPGEPASVLRVALAVVGAALLLVMALGYIANRSVELRMVNRLSVPIGVVAGAERERRVAPGDSSVFSIRRAPSLSLSWYAIGPPGRRGQAGGRDLQRTQLLDARQRHVRLEARADSSEPPLFLPYVTNGTSQPLTIRLNVGSSAEVSCRCTVPAGASRMPLGFYPLYRNSSVRAILPNGRVATFEGLGSKVDRASGVVRLRFDEGDFRDPKALQGRLSK
jgi:tRNA A-37 threonylcarbamoyl transferase component Bud32